MEKLTQTQKDLIEKNHGLIYGYAHKKKLDIDEYYDILALGMCRAAQSYDSSKSKFPTWAYMCMDSVINAHDRGLKRHKRKHSDDVVEIYLDEPLHGHYGETRDKSTVGEFTVIPTISLIDLCEGRIMADTMMAVLTDKEQKVALMKIQGLSNSQIGKTLGCSSANISYLINKIRDKFFLHFSIN